MAPIWIDTNILIDIYEGKLPFAEGELLQLQKQGKELLIPKAVEHEFLEGKRNMSPVQRAERVKLLDRMKIKVDMTANKTPLVQLRAWRQAAIDSGLSIPDSNVVANVKAGAEARSIKDPTLLSNNTKDLPKMRQQGLVASEFKPQAIKPIVPVAPPTTPSTEPKPARFFRGGMKDAFKQGLKDAFKAGAIAAEIPLVVLHFANKFAKRDALRNIQTKFIKEGFAKGVAAGIMGWTYSEAHSNLTNRVTPFRMEGMGDPGGELTRSQILQVAEAWENYSVDVGFGYSEP
jgi:predicted nucleic acid-binding protein